MGGERIVQFRSLDESRREQMEDLSDWFHWELENVIGLREAMEEILHYTLVDGICLPVPEYIREERTTFTTLDLEYDTKRGLSEQMEIALPLIFRGDAIDTIDPQEKAGVYKVYLLDHPDKPATVTFLLDQQMLTAEIERLTTVFDGVRIHVPNVEDIVVPNTCTEINRLPFFGIRSWLQVGEFIDECREGGLYAWMSEDDQNSVKASATASRSGSIISQEMSEEQDRIEGTNSLGDATSGAVEDERNWIEVFRWEGIVRTKRSGKVDVVVWTAPRASLLLRIVRLTELNKDGLRSPVKFEFIKAPGRFMGIGLGELLQHMQTEMDGIHNYRLDNGVLNTAQSGFYEPAAGLGKDTFQMEPGKWYPAKNVDKIKPLEQRWSAVWGFNEESLVKRYANELSGLGDMGSGSFVSKRVSAAEFMGTSESVNIRTKHIVHTVIRSMEQLLYRIFGLYQQHARQARIYQVAGEKGETLIKRLSLDRMHGKMSLRLIGNVRHLAGGAETEQDMSVLTLLLNPSLMEAGITRPETIYTALQKLLRAMDYHGIPLFKPKSPPDSPPPEEEHRMMLLGEPVEPHMGEDMDLHLSEHVTLLSDPEFSLKIPDQNARAALAQHVQKTMQMRQQMEMLQQIQSQKMEQLRGQLGQMGVRPGLAGGSQSGNQSQPAEADEIAGGMMGGMMGGGSNAGA
jgi:hypothetical protein